MPFLCLEKMAGFTHSYFLLCELIIAKRAEAVNVGICRVTGIERSLFVDER